MIAVHDAVTAQLRERGLRYTRSRRAVVDVLAAGNGPMTLPEILECEDDLAQSSAYRNLAELVDAGVVLRIVTEDEHGRFELAESITGDHHHHLICSNCGSVEDFVVPPDLERAIASHLDGVTQSTGFVTEHHRLDLIGHCSGCD